jgi:hypothetical protein
MAASAWVVNTVSIIYSAYNTGRGDNDDEELLHQSSHQFMHMFLLTHHFNHFNSGNGITGFNLMEAGATKNDEYFSHYS